MCNDAPAYVFSLATLCAMERVGAGAQVERVAGIEVVFRKPFMSPRLCGCGCSDDVVDDDDNDDDEDDIIVVARESHSPHRLRTFNV